MCRNHRDATVSSPDFIYDNVVGFNSGECLVSGVAAVYRLALISTYSPQFYANLAVGISCDRDFGALYRLDYPT